MKYPKKIQTTYELTPQYQLVVLEGKGSNDHMSLCTFEPCDGILQHWGTKTELVKELRGLATKLELFEPPTNEQTT